MVEKEMKEWVRLTISKLLEYMYIDLVDIRIKFVNKQDYSKNNYGEYVLDIQYNTVYKQAVLNIHPHAVMMYKQDRFVELKHAIQHELAHLHTIPLTDIAKRKKVDVDALHEECERLTELLAMYIENMDTKKFKRHTIH